jgi:DNA gyrase subunit B
LSATWIAPKEKLVENGIHIITEKQGIPVEVAMTYNTSYNENVYSYVNNINTIEGGTHLAGFRRGLDPYTEKVCGRFEDAG